MISTTELIARLAIRNIHQVKDHTRRADLLEFIADHLTVDLQTQQELKGVAGMIRRAESQTKALSSMTETTLND